MSKNKVLVIGSSGQVASCLKEVASKNFLFVGRPLVDICDNRQLQDAITIFQPDLIINCSAYTAVDRAEQEPDLAYKINAQAVEELSKLCAENNIPLIHLSTDYVFDGIKEVSYVESDQPNPLSVYGKSKFQGEENIKKYLEKYIILRTSWVFSPYGTNFVKTMLNLALTKPQISIVNDQKGCPTAASNIAMVILQIANKILASEQKVTYGIYHYTDSPAITWYKFAENIFDLLAKKNSFKIPIIKPITTAEYPTLASRPLNSVLDCSLIKKNFSIKQQSWAKALEEYLGQLVNKI